MAKLRALRLAQEATDLANAPPPLEKKKAAPRTKTAAKA
jgi:hypothetical protein